MTLYQFKSCLSENTISVELPTEDISLLENDKVYQFTTCFGCWQYIGTTSGTGTLYKIKHKFDNCQSCIGNVVKPKYEKLVDNRTDYYPSLEFNCSAEQIENTFCKLNDVLTYKYLLTKYKVFSDRIKHIKNKIISSFIEWWILDYELHRSGDDCCPDTGTCCPPCLYGFTEMISSNCPVPRFVRINVPPCLLPINVNINQL